MTEFLHSTKTATEAHALSRATDAALQRACERGARHEISRAVADWCWGGEAACLAERIGELEDELKQRAAPPTPRPDGLRTPAKAARKLNCSVKTLNRHVATGALKYVAVGHGKKRQQRMFTDADLDEFIANQTRKDVPCPSTAPRARHSGTSISGGEVIGFMARRNARRGVKPKT